ncbi:MAG: thioesterase family protein [Alicyclobacillaceae bacterium]|uniref:acyl-CoA thioesterase n=1 Tax=Alicyclobacillus sp. SP_1 TaxID=2942475 RepID=UPI0021578C51|nr:thioesterase family protein [Alicyclobacillus sp. SP_1]MCY0887590.1 thioesterase family protein [Alicyclobacillaceae bacterium]MCY0897045.1 thioesterase family protein [Alicyclobacillaceae bacterium]
MLRQQQSIRFHDCDGLGHVNNAAYFTLMEEARREIFRWFNPDLQLSNWSLIVASAKCDFLAQVPYGVTVDVWTWVGKIGNSSFVLDHAILLPNSDYAARGQATLIHFDYATKKAIRIPDDLKHLLYLHADEPEGVPALRA